MIRCPVPSYMAIPKINLKWFFTEGLQCKIERDCLHKTKCENKKGVKERKRPSKN